jgi:hypothetical protein
MAVRFKTRGIKSNKAYRIDELADAAGVSTPTVRNWIKAGMFKVDDTRPTLIIGFQALDFLNQQRRKAKRPLAVGEFYCMGCKAPRMPFEMIADYYPTGLTGGRLKSFCGVCEAQCNRNISAFQLSDFAKVLNIANSDN